MPDNVNLTSLGKAPIAEPRTPAAVHEDHAHIAASLLTCGSIEFSNGRPDEIAAVAERLPRGMPVFVPALPGRTLESRLELIAALHRAGLDPVPHLAARLIPSRENLRDFLAEARSSGGLHRVLIIGGDSRDVAGPYPDAEAVLRDGLLSEHGITEVGFAGYPGGHPWLSTEQVRRALLGKLGLAAQLGLGSHIVTQFSFVPARILEYSAWLSSVTPDTPVYVGLAGPASLRQLVHFARYCGVTASLSAVGRLGVRVVQLVDHMRADEQLGLLASWVDTHAHANCNITGVHLFSFGGFTPTAQWMYDHISAV
jgi:methylenetetrahydrofolate reductase (NADPH)